MKKILTKTSIIAEVALLTYILLIAEGLVAPRCYIGIVASGSMEPTIKTGAMVVLKPYKDSSEVKVGDVATFQNSEVCPAGSVIHRVIAINENSAITKGDNNLYADGETSLSDFSCKAVLVINATSCFLGTYNRTPLAEILENQTLITIAKAIMLFYCGYDVFELLKMTKEEEEKRQIRKT